MKPTETVIESNRRHAAMREHDIVLIVGDLPPPQEINEEA